MQDKTAPSENAPAAAIRSVAPRTPRVLTRWKITLTCSAVALCMLLGTLVPSGAMASVAAESIEFFRSYGSVLVAAMALTTLVVADMMAWPLLTRSNEK